MKKIIVLFIAVLLWFVFPVKAEPVDTYHSRWHLIRETADEDGDTFALVYNLTTDGDFASKDSNSVANGGAFHIPAISDPGTEGYSPGTKWMFAICGKNYNNVDDTFSFNLIGWAKDNGMLQNIVEGSGTLGTQAVITYPDDGADALGSDISETSVVYDHSGGATEQLFTVTNEGFDGAVAGMLAYVTGTNITSGYYQVGTVTDTNNIAIAVSATDDATDATVQINPAFWADTLTLDETTKWPLDMGGDGANAQVYNSGDNEVCVLVADLTGIEWIQFVIYDADAATGEEAGDLTVYGRRY